MQHKVKWQAAPQRARVTPERGSAKRAREAAAENRARAVLLENGWQLRAGDNPAVIVAENGERTLYGSSFTEVVGRAVRPEKPRFPSKTREGRARVAAASI